MKKIVFEPIATKIPRTTMTKVYIDGAPTYYHIQAVEGYALHDKVRDYSELDPGTMEETKRLGYTTDYTTCGVNYNFSPVTVTGENGVTFTAYGPREFAARPAATVKD